MNFGIVELYCGSSGKKGFYNSQEIGLARAMKKLGYTSFIFYPERDGESITEEPVEEDITIIRCPAKTFGVHSKYDWSVLNKYRINAVQVGSDNQIYAPSLIKYCDKHKIPVYSLIGTVGTDSTNIVKKVLMGVLYKRNLAAYRSHMNYAKTNTVRSRLNSLGIDRVGLAPVGLDVSIIPEICGTVDEIREESNLPKDKKILLYVGRIDAYKKPEKMLAVLSDMPAYYGIIIGDGALSEEFEKNIHDMGLNGRLKWIKKLPNDEVQKYYYAADYFLNFNSQEIFGMSILEAMYQGCTVIAVHAPGPDSIIADQQTGFLVNEYSEMEEIIRNNKFINRETARNHILKNFIWDNSAKQFDDWIRQHVKV